MLAAVVTGGAPRLIPKSRFSTYHLVTRFGAVEFYTPDPTEGGTVRYTHRSVGGPAGPQGLPLMGPPYSRLSAIDLNRGEIAWQTPTGNGDRYRKHEALAHLDLPPLGG